MINKLIASLINYKTSNDYKKRVRTTMNELSKLSQHELSDIGITRGDIYHVAHQTYKRPMKVTSATVDTIVNPNLKDHV